MNQSWGGTTLRKYPESGQSTTSNSYDEVVMARFGKKQQLKVDGEIFGTLYVADSRKRRFGSLSAVGLISGLMVTWISFLV